jgi:tellurite resistance protein
MTEEKSESVDELDLDPSEAEQREATRTRLEKGAVELAERRKIADSVRTEDMDVAERIQKLGFDDQTARIFDLLPLVHVAWADGKIQKQERASILRVVEARGITKGSAAMVMMESLLEKQPSQTYLDETLAVLHDLLGGNKRRVEVMVDLCVAVAEAAGGFLGFGNPVDPDERKLLDHIAGELGDRAEVWLKAKMGEAPASK